MRIWPGILFIAIGIALLIASGPIDRLRQRIGVRPPTPAGIPLPSTPLWMPFKWSVRLGGVFVTAIGVLIITGMMHSGTK